MNDDFSPLTGSEREEIIRAEEPCETSRETFLSYMRRNKTSLVALTLLTLLVLLAILGPLCSPYTYSQTDLPRKNQPPSSEHIFGTDELGRDLFTRVCTGLGVSLEIGLIAALIDLAIGVSWGLIAGYLGGKTDQVMMRMAEMVYCLPYLLFVILVTAVIGPGFAPIITAMVVIGWIQMARITRNLVMQIKATEYFSAAVSLGVGPLGLVRRHILPNILGPIACVVMLTIPQAIFCEAFLSFLGIGIQPPLASLGSLVSDALGAMRYYPWRLFIPSLFITSVIFAFNLLGDVLRDLLDPHVRRNWILSHAKANS